MGLMDKLKNAAQGAKGKGKEATGRARGDKSQETAGQADQVKSDIKDIGENTKDAFRRDE
jgi:uncharacterized protein YjbJ (UPF0337 family)